MERKTIIWYGIPAYGHINSNLYLARLLSEKKTRVVYYSTKAFQSLIEENGCEYRSYPILQEELDLSDGQWILKLYRLILEYTWKMLPVLLEEAEREKPCGVVLESFALWGREVGRQLKVPVFSFYSIMAADRIFGKGFFAYVKGFLPVFFLHVGEIPAILHLRQVLKKKWGMKRLGMIHVLMIQGNWNLMGYSRFFQIGGESFGKRFLFLGPMSVHRNTIERNDFSCPKKDLVYISSGSILNQNERLLREVIKQFGRKKSCGEGNRKKEYTVVLVGQEKENMEFPDNFIVRNFVNQKEVLQQADLLITSGGMNSIHEALYYGVPCLIYPQQGEQLLNGEQFEKLGFGIVLKNPVNVRQEAEKAMDLKNTWNEELRKKVVSVHTEDVIKIFQRICHCL